jgi:trk system potassium uptake protein TrkA
MTALVEEAVAIGDLVRIFTFRESGSLMVEITMGSDAAILGKPVRAVAFPQGAVLTGIIRGGRPIPPDLDETFAAGDELLFLVDVDVETALRAMLTART